MSNPNPLYTGTSFDDNFFNVFDYVSLMHDAIDHGLVYEFIHILRDITTANGSTLRKGDEYEQVNFNFLTATFSFIVWDSIENSSDGIVHPKVLVEIPQSELAPFLKW